MSGQKELCTRVAAVIEEGKLCRQTGGICPYRANTVRHLLHTQGWLTEDLRIGFMTSNARYAKQQEAFGQGLDKLPKLRIV